MSSLRWPGHWSHTTLDLYECPAALECKLRGEAAVRPQNVYGGSDLHEAIARLAQAAWENGTTKHDEAAKQIAQGYAEPVRSNFLAFAKSARFPWPKVRGGRDTVCPVEQMWECDLPRGAGKFIGRIDLAFVDEGAEAENPFADSSDVVKIVDWKQGRPKTWWQPECPPQLRRYAWMHKQRHPEAKEFDCFYGAPNWKGDWAFRCWHLSARELEGVGDELASTVERIKATERFEPRPSEERCGSCFYIHACPLHSARYMQLQMLTPEDHANAAAWHKLAAAMHEDLVYQSVQSTGREVIVGNKRYGVSSPEAGFEVVNVPLLAQILTEAEDFLKEPKAKQPAARRVLKLDADNSRRLITKLLESEKYAQRTAAAVKVKPAGAPRIGLYNLRPVEDDDTADEPEEG